MQVNRSSHLTEPQPRVLRSSIVVRELVGSYLPHSTMDHEAANSGGQWTSMSFISAFLVLLGFYVIWREYSIWFLHLPHIPSAFWNTPSCYYQLATNGYAGRLYILNKERHDKHGMWQFHHSMR